MAEKKNPHMVEENPEEHLGQPLLDPWVDKGVDWPSVEAQIDHEKDYTEEDDTE